MDARTYLKYLRKNSRKKIVWYGWRDLNPQFSFFLSLYIALNQPLQIIFLLSAIFFAIKTSVIRWNVRSQLWMFWFWFSCLFFLYFLYITRPTANNTISIYVKINPVFIADYLILFFAPSFSNYQQYSSQLCCLTRQLSNFLANRSVLESQCLGKFQRLSMVRMEGLEPPRLSALEPKSSVSTNSTTSAK